MRIGRCLPYGEGITFYRVRQIVTGWDRPREVPRGGARGARERGAEAGGADAVVRRLEVVLGLSEAPDALPDLAADHLMPVSTRVASVPQS